MVRPNMEIDMVRAGQVIVFLKDPDHEGMSNNEAAKRLGVHESFVRRSKEAFQWGLWSMLNIASIRLDGGTQLRIEQNDSVIKEYAEVIKSGGSLPPPVVFYDGTDHWCADGHQRIAAARLAGKRKIECDVRTGTLRDAIIYACGCNEKHGMRRTSADRKNAIMTALADPELAARNNNEEIARVCNVSQKLVRYYREQETPVNDGCSEGEMVTQKSKNGRTYTRKKPSPKKATVGTDSPNPSHNGTPALASSPVSVPPSKPSDPVSESADEDQEAIAEVSEVTPQSEPAPAAPSATKPCPCCNGTGRVPIDFEEVVHT